MKLCVFFLIQPLSCYIQMNVLLNSYQHAGMLGDRSAASEDVEEVSEARAELVPLCAAASVSKPSASASQLLHHSVTVDDLWNYVSVKKAARSGGLRQEYEVLNCWLSFTM